ncbi:CBS domain-containing protein [Desulfobacula sp.]|uniref:CBS domain-containing protein n=1 Tax=Desulfobacula sp. TaxID=2593537 RepID=UPI0025BCB1E5|nr:CBS domain-containing protein [Desulfobacula sp.]MBC2705407.1 CBS domain-containing protein [Desulfobacula sp.]
MKVKDCLEECAGHFHTIEQDQTVEQALKLMSGYNVSALVVMKKETSQGIFTERDLLRCHIIFSNKDIKNILVKEVMTSKLIVAEPGDTIEDAMGMMIKAKIRHLPVVLDGQIKGMLSLEDLVKKHVSVLNKELHYLKDYISDLQDAAYD